MLRLCVHFLCRISLDTCHILFVFICLGLEFLHLGQLQSSTFDPILFIIFFFKLVSSSLGDKHSFHKSIRTLALYPPLTKGRVEGSTRVERLGKNEDPHPRSTNLQLSPENLGQVKRSAGGG